MEHESDQENSLTSIVHIQASEVYPKKSPCVEDVSLSITFPLLHGEYATYLGRITEGIVALSNFRLFVHTQETFFNIPLGLIEQVECRDIFYLHIYCKDARSVRCTFSTNEHCMEWHRRLFAATSPPKRLDDIFAFPFRAWCSEESRMDLHQALSPEPLPLFKLEKETARMGFNVKTVWRISCINTDHKFCPTYPKELLVPSSIEDEELQQVASFRSSRRIPIVVWRHQSNGSVIARCSQPEVGWLGWRNNLDENLVQAIAKACSLDRGLKESVGSGLERAFANGSIGGNEPEEKLIVPKILILDARSYAAAVANRAKGGGCECPDYYPNCEIQFMSLANIHYIRKSFHSVRALCATSPDQTNWFSMIENTKWLQHMSGLLKAALTVVNAVDMDARPVLVHCSDGWDRTPQIVALAEIMLDPFYRTLDGFQILVEREWLEFGHKFGDRCGHGLQADDTNERCPVFLQWLDCIHQLLHQFPCSFEFNETFLVKLVHHTYSCLFGTFLCNSLQERLQERVAERTYSVWAFLRANNHRFKNFLFVTKDQVLRPSCHVRDLQFWSTVYMPSSATTDEIMQPLVTPPLPSAMLDSSLKTDGEGGSLSKTKSCENLSSVNEHSQNRPRRSSDPSVLDGKPPFPQCLENGVCDDDPEDLHDDRILFQGYDVKYSHAAPCSPGGKSLDVKNRSPKANGTGSVDIEDAVIAMATVSAMEDAQPSSDSAAFESSTDTLVGELAGHYGEPQLDGLCVPSGDGAVPCLPSKETDNCDHRTKVFTSDKCTKQSTTHWSTVSTSTSDISDSHVTAKEMKQSTAVGINGHHQSWMRVIPFARCPFCINGKKLPETNHYDDFKHPSSGADSVNSTPLHSRTPSSGFPATPNDDRLSECAVFRCPNVLANKLDVDGLTVLRDEVQHRLCEIVSAHWREAARLKQELHATRLALYKQVCYKCNGSTHLNQDHEDEVVSLPDSVGSGEQHSLGLESNSDVSWEQVEEYDTRPILWVPDHAVTRCMGCETEFWLGCRKHHCRNCGKIFCANCSSQMVPIPNEQLYHPVRVCSYCFDNLRSTRCKQQAFNGESKLNKPIIPATATTAAASN